MKPRIIQPELRFCHKEWVEQYDKIAASAMAPMFRHFAACIKKTAAGGSRILDIGSGSGRLFLAVHESGFTAPDYVGIDISPEMARKAVGNSRGVELRITPEFPVAAANRLPFCEASFDLVVSSSSLHMWTDPVGVFNEVHRVLRPGGVGLIRDSRRLPDGWLWRWFVRTAAARRGMNEMQKRAWTGAIQASYSLSEVRDILRQTKFQDWKVSVDKVFFEICLKLVK